MPPPNYTQTGVPKYKPVTLYVNYVTSVHRLVRFTRHTSWRKGYL